MYRSTTWAVRDRSSCIDYCIGTPDLGNHISSMVTDEDGTGNLGSYHNRLRLNIQHNQKVNVPPSQGPRFTEQQLQTIAQELELVVSDRWSYDVMISAMRKHVEDRLKNTTSGHRKRVPWCLGGPSNTKEEEGKHMAQESGERGG